MADKPEPIVAPVEQSEAAPTLCPGEDARDCSRADRSGLPDATDGRLGRIRRIDAFIASDDVRRASASIGSGPFDAGTMLAALAIKAWNDGWFSHDDALREAKPRSEPSSSAPTLSDAETRALIEDARALVTEWGRVGGYLGVTAAQLIDRLADTCESLLEAASRSESTDARRVATPGFADPYGPRPSDLTKETERANRNYIEYQRATDALARTLWSPDVCRIVQRFLGGAPRSDDFARLVEIIRPEVPLAEKRAGATGEPVTARAETDDGETK